MAEVRIIGIMFVAPGTNLDEVRLDIVVHPESKIENLNVRVIYKDRIYWLQGTNKRMNGRYIFNLLRPEYN